MQMKGVRCVCVCVFILYSPHCIAGPENSFSEKKLRKKIGRHKSVHLKF